MITFFNYLLIFNVFAGGFILFSSPFEFYVGYIFIIFFLVIYILHYRNISINSNFLIILIALTISSLVNVYLRNNTLFFMLKQVVGISITGIAYYLLIKINKYKIDKLFKIYLRIALMVAVIGIFQEFSFLAGFKSGYDYSYIIPKWWFFPTTFGMLKVNSIFMEPSHFAISMAPASFVSLMAILRNNSSCLSKKASILIIISVILTFSAVAYIVILISLLLIYSNVRKFRYLLLTAIIIPIFIYTTYRYIPEIRMRFNDTLEVVTGSKKAVDTNLSTYSLSSNTFVAYKNFTDSPLFGRGLGSYPISYNEVIYSGVSGGFWRKDVPVLNSDDAGSLFLRLVSETGLFGIILVLYFVFKFRLKNSGNRNLQIISNAIFIMFMMQLLKQGHYFYNGLFFFVWLYYFAYKIYKQCKIDYSSNA